MMNKNNNVHTVSVFVANKPGVLVRCAQVFARRGYNIDSLVVSTGVDPKFSRMTITATGDPQTLDQIIKQTSKLVDVLHCVEHTGQDSVDREYAMIKVSYSSTATRNSIKKFIKSRAHVITEDSGTVIIGQAGTSEELDLFEGEFKKKFNVIEIVRSGKLVMAIGKAST